MHKKDSAHLQVKFKEFFRKKTGVEILPPEIIGIKLVYKEYRSLT